MSNVTNIDSAGGTNKKPRYKLTPVDPETARRWLDKNKVNRRLRPRRVEKYARDMKAGNWRIGNDAICFSPEGNLLNGQHRLHAVIENGATVMMLIAWNIPKDSMPVMDSGAGRTASDALLLDGYKDATVLAASAKFLILRDRNLLTYEGNADVTHSEVLDYVESHPMLLEAASMATLKSKIQSTPTAIAVGWYLIAEADGSDAATEFFTALAELVGLAKGDPILAVVSRLRTLGAQRTRVPNRLLIDVFIRAYNMRKSGVRRTTIRLQELKGFVLTEVAS